MVSLTVKNPFPLPPTADLVFTRLWGDEATSQSSNTQAFSTGINRRDNRACVICGMNDFEALKRYYIVPRDELDTWELMRGSDYIPRHAKSVQHESRNGILLCASHHNAFHLFRFYIRWFQETDEFIVVNHSRMQAYDGIHGNILPFNTTTKRCPFPTVFLWHESRVRGYHPTYDDRPIIVKRGVQQGGRFGTSRSKQGHDAPSNDRDKTNSETFTPTPLTGDNLQAWLNAAKQHSSWRDCIIENTSWEGTTEENIEKYRREVGVLAESIESLK